jgi:hypothetical protein
MNHGRIITNGIPIAESRYRSLMVLSESTKVSEALRKNSMIAKQAVT